MIRGVPARRTSWSPFRAPANSTGPIRPPGPDEGGFTIIEVTVALVIFALIAAMTVGLVIKSLNASGESRRRVAAASLAAREIDITRAQFTSPSLGPTTVATGKVTDGNPLTGFAAGSALLVDGVPYTVTRTSQWQSQGGTAGACDGGASGQLSYLRVSVAVTWPNMASVNPVISNTLLTPQQGTYPTGTGNASVKVTDSTGAPTGGQTVTLVGPSGTTSQTTADDGCAFFAFLSTGTYTASVTTPGYVDQSWNPSATATATITSGAVTSFSLPYAQASTLTTAASAPSGYGVPTAMGYTAYNTALLSSTHTLALPTRGTSVTTSVWPYASGLTMWSGTCLDADPASGRTLPVVTGPGAAATSAPALQPVRVTVTHSAVAVPTVQVVAVHAADAGCPASASMIDPLTGSQAGEVLRPTVTTDSLGNSQVGLPIGKWTIKVVGKLPTSSWPVVVLGPISGTTALVPVAVQ
jgi:prepilin-type N-terminal cleavage/methylation domain-containing protein